MTPQTCLTRGWLCHALASILCACRELGVDFEDVLSGARTLADRMRPGSP